MRTIKLLGVVAAVAIGVGPARAQDAAPAPAHVAVVDGTAMLDRDGQVDQAVANMPFVSGDHLRTTSGRIEILFPDGTALDVDEFSEVALESDTAVRLGEGRALLRIPRARYVTTAYELTTPATSITATTPGEYRLSYPDAYESARVEDFDRWVGAQASAAPAASASAQYLPSDLQMYGPTFDQYGGWQYDQSYGYVWYPTVSEVWRPYYDGYWAPVPSYGWTWIGMGAWSWPTHHYGRWGWHHDRWFWIPARSWAPAWVAWGAAADYVSWCPLGWDSRPVFALSLSYGDPWRGWTVLPRDAFGRSRVYVARHVVPPARIRLTSTPFVVQSRAPVAAPRAIASNVTPGGIGRRPTAIPRNGAPMAAPRYGRGAAPPAATPATRDKATRAPAYRGQPGQQPATAVPRYGRPTAPYPVRTAPAPIAIDRRGVSSPPPAGVSPGPAYRMPNAERRAMTPTPQAAPPRPMPSRIAPLVPPSAAQAPPAAAQPAPSRIAMPRQQPASVRPQPIVRPQAQPAPAQQAQPARPQAQPRAEPAGGGRSPSQPSGGQQQARPRGGERRPR